MKAWVIASLAIVSVAGAAFALGVFARPLMEDESASPPGQPPPVPTQYQPGLTGAEAAAKARNFFMQKAPEELKTALLKLRCTASDFNQSTRDWIVVCEYTGGTNVSLRVDDVSGLVEPLR